MGLFVNLKSPCQLTDRPLVQRLSLAQFGQWLGLLTLIGSPLIGCRPADSVERATAPGAVAAGEKASAAGGAAPRDRASDRSAAMIGEAMRYLPKVSQLERDAAVREINLQLNAFLSSSDSLADTITTADLQPWLELLPADLVGGPWAEHLSQPLTDQRDCEFLLQARLFQDTARWVVSLPYRDPLFAAWLDEQVEQLGTEAGGQLLEAAQLFDWTVRNVWASGEAAAIGTLIEDSSRSTAGLPAQPPPGAARLPWQTLLFGQGDAIERGRVFSQLAFQRSIPVVWLGKEPIQPGDPNRLWCLAVPIGDQLYLFDPRLGLPIPGPGGVGIATLAQAKRDSSVLRRARLPGQFDYAVTAADLDPLVAWLDVEPISLAKSMQRLEGQLIGDLRMRLAADPKLMAETVQAADAKLQVRLWPLPWRAQQHNQWLREQLRETSVLSFNYQRQYAMFLSTEGKSGSFGRARRLHLRGVAESSKLEEGAANMYMQGRVAEELLTQLPFDPKVQMELGIRRALGEDETNWRMRAEISQEALRQAKQSTSYFLAQLQFCEGNLGSARDWLEKRLLPVAGTERWHPASWYLLGRIAELNRDLAAAEDYYRRPGTPQEAGNRLRLRLLTQSGLLQTPPPTE
jgi:hypothetical protein